jgi:acetyltransferase-like isoleucine patch superfamily enzyme
MLKNIFFTFLTYPKYLYQKIIWCRNGSILRSKLVSLKANIGRKVIINKNVFIDSHSSIGDFTYINQNCSIEGGNLGKFCSVASGVQIGPADHNYKLISTHPFWYQKHYGFNINSISSNPTSNNTTIGHDVWIGINSIIKHGVTIGTGVVIGAGSVVTKNIPPYEIWAGVPARKIKSRFDVDTIELLLDIDWPNFDDKKINKFVIGNINNPHLFVNIRKSFNC